MESDGGLVGSARLVLAGGVSFLDPESAVFEAMLAGWDRQQRVRFAVGSSHAWHWAPRHFTGKVPGRWAGLTRC